MGDLTEEDIEALRCHGKRLAARMLGCDDALLSREDAAVFAELERKERKDSVPQADARVDRFG